MGFMGTGEKPTFLRVPFSLNIISLTPYSSSSERGETALRSFVNGPQSHNNQSQRSGSDTIAFLTNIRSSGHC